MEAEVLAWVAGALAAAASVLRVIKEDVSGALVAAGVALIAIAAAVGQL